MEQQIQLTIDHIEKQEIKTTACIFGIEQEYSISFDIDESQKPATVLKKLNKYLDWLASGDCRELIIDNIAAVLDVVEINEDSLRISSGISLIVDEDGDPGISAMLYCAMPDSDDDELEIVAVLGGKNGKEIYEWDTEIV